MKAFWLLVIGVYELSFVASYCPERCLCLWYTDYTLTINCSGSEQKEVPYGIDPQVKVLDLSYNEIKTYNHSKYLKVVEEIDLSNNKVTEAYFGGSFKFLECINLSNNSIADLKSVNIQNLKKLKKLNLSFNAKLNHISGLKSDSLEFLDLSHCYVYSIEKEFLDLVPNIRSIDLSFNSFKSLKNIQSKTLENLDVSHGQMENLTRNEIVNLPNLTKLNVSFNSNLKIDFSYENSCWDIRELDVSNSELTFLNDMFPFCSLEVLNASINKIEIIEVRTFYNNCELVFLNLSSNRISQIFYRSFFTTEKLKILDLSVNHIQDVNFSLYLQQVTDLDLSDNQISTLVDLVLKNAINLNLSKNKIHEISINFNEKVPKLQNLNLSHNRIKIINKINSKTLTQIDISYCEITSLDIKAFENSPNLVLVNLDGNKLTTLDSRVFSPLKNLKFMGLGYNPWACNCQSQEFKDFYEFLKIGNSLTNVQNLKCAKSNDTWRNTCLDVWHQEKEWKKTVYSLTVSLAIALIVVVVIFFCKYFNDKKQMRQIVRAVREDREESLTDIYQCSYNDNSTEGVPNRSSTPPPNYEAALLLPKLTEELRKKAISTLSIDTPMANQEEETRVTTEAGETAENQINQNITRNNE